MIDATILAQFVLQARCSPGKRELFLDGEFWDSAYCFFTAPAGAQSLVPMMIVGGILVSLFIVSRTITLPSVVGIVLSGILFVAVPATVTNLIIIVLLFALSIGGVILGWRMEE